MLKPDESGIFGNTEEDIKFSIVVPCYNVDKYIDECVNSVLNQTYANWELLLINDGSSDKTLSSIRHFENLDTRISVYNIDHSGPSKARNTGIEHADGDYLVFLDGDDYFAHDHLYNDHCVLKKSHFDMLIHNQHTYFTKKSFNPFVLFDIPSESLTPAEMLKCIFSLDNHLPGATFLTTYSLSFLRQNKICFNDSYTISEDLDFFMHAISTGPSIGFASHEFYYYRVDNINSLTKNITCEGEMERLNIYKKWYDHFQDKTIDEFNTEIIQRKIASDLIGEAYISYDWAQKGYKAPKKFLSKNRYLLHKNSLFGSFGFIYHIKCPLRKLKQKLHM